MNSLQHSTTMRTISTAAEQGLSGFDFNVSVVSLRVLERRGGYTHYDLTTASKLIAVTAALVRDYVGI